MGAKDLRHKARVALRKEHKPIPPILEKGTLRDIVAKKEGAMATVRAAKKAQKKKMEEKKRTKKQQREADRKHEEEIDRKMKHPKVLHAKDLRHKARVALRKEHK